LETRTHSCSAYSCGRVGQLTMLPHIYEVKVVPAIFVITNVEGKERRTQKQITLNGNHS